MSNNKRCCNPRFGVVNEPFFCPKMQAYVVRGSKGETGMQGPQGPRGLNGIITNNATLTQSEQVTVFSNGNLPFSNNLALNGIKIMHTEGSADIILDAGVYLFIWSMTASPEGEVNQISVALGLNNQIINGTNVTFNTTNTANLSGNAILTVPQYSTINLKNLGVATTFSNIMLTIVNLS